jgi:hypothetical protein
MKIAMRGLLILSGAVLLLAGCAPSEPAVDTGPDFRPVATIREIMNYQIDPSADAIWASVATVVDLDGVHEEYPETEDEWDVVRAHTMRIIEGVNLLLMPGRQVAQPGIRSEFPEIELHPEQVQELIDGDRATFTEYAMGLHERASATLAAIDARDVDGLLASGEMLDVACERCHLHYWYPNDTTAREQFEESERLRQEAGIE